MQNCITDMHSTYHKGTPFALYPTVQYVHCSTMQLLLFSSMEMEPRSSRAPNMPGCIVTHGAAVV